MIRDITEEDVNVGAAKQTVENPPRRIFNIASILLILSFVLFLFQLVNLGTFRAKASGVDSLPVSIRATSQADYSGDAYAATIPAIGQNILRQIILDIPAAGSAEDRIETLQALLLSPVPTMTANNRLPVTATPTRTLTAVSTSTLPVLVMTFASPTRFILPTPTLVYPSPTYQHTASTATRTPKLVTMTTTFSPTLTKTSTPTFPTTATSTATSTRISTFTSTASPTRTFTPISTSTATYTPTRTVTPSQTPTNTPTNTDTSTPTTTQTATSTDTPTLTATNTWTASPTVTLSSGCVAYPSGGVVALKDTWVDNTNPDLSYASDTTFKVRPSAGVDQRALVAFDLSSIPPGSTVLSAALYLTVTTGDNYDVQFYPITQSWAESVTWNTKPTYDATSAGSITLTTNTCTRVSSFSTSLVSSWINDPANNYGIYLYPPAGAGQADFSSREGSSPPILVISYIP